MNFPKILWILTGIPRKSFKVLQNSWIPQYLESARFAIFQKLLLSLLEILKFSSTQFSVVHRGVWIFSGIAHYGTDPLAYWIVLNQPQRQQSLKFFNEWRFFCKRSFKIFTTVYDRHLDWSDCFTSSVLQCGKRSTMTNECIHKGLKFNPYSRFEESAFRIWDPRNHTLKV